MLSLQLILRVELSFKFKTILYFKEIAPVFKTKITQTYQVGHKLGRSVLQSFRGYTSTLAFHIIGEKVTASLCAMGLSKKINTTLGVNSLGFL